HTTDSNTLVVGKPLSVVKGYQYLGVSSDSGLYTFRDVRKDGVLDAHDVVAGGNLDPKYYGGFGQTINYKQWQFDLFFEFRRQGGLNPYVILYQQGYIPGFAGTYFEGNAPVEFEKRWRQPGDRAALQQVTESVNSTAYARIQDYISSTAVARDASFIRLKNLA